MSDDDASLLERCPEDMAFFRDRIDASVIDTLEHIVNAPFERMTYGEAIAILERSGRDFEFPVKWGADLQSEHERQPDPVVILDHEYTSHPSHHALSRRAPPSDGARWKRL